MVCRIDSASSTSEDAAYTAMSMVGMTYEEIDGEEWEWDDVIGCWKFKESFRGKCAKMAEIIARLQPDDVGVENAHDGEDVAQELEELLDIDIRRIQATSAKDGGSGGVKHARLRKHSRRFDKRVRWHRSLEPQAIRATGDDTLPNPIDEILGNVPTMDVADTVEMCLREVQVRSTSGASPICVYDGEDLTAADPVETGDDGSPKGAQSKDFYDLSDVSGGSHAGPGSNPSSILS